ADTCTSRRSVHFAPHSKDARALSGYSASPGMRTVAGLANQLQAKISHRPGADGTEFVLTLPLQLCMPAATIAVGWLLWFPHRSVVPFISRARPRRNRDCSFPQA